MGVDRSNSRHDSDIRNTDDQHHHGEPSHNQVLHHDGQRLYSGQHTLDDVGLEFLAVVPEDSAGPFPVLLMFHNRGHPGDGEGLMSLFSWWLASAFPHSITSTHIQITPKGMAARWDYIPPQASKRDDLTVIGETLLEYLSSFDNVKPQFKLIGFSQGAGLVNRFLVENNNPHITHAVTCGTQLTLWQWRNGSFFVGGKDHDFQTSKKGLQHRRILQITGGLDTMMPANGGMGIVGIPALPWEESIYRYAQEYGWEWGQIAPTVTASYDSVSYFQGKNQAYNYKQAHHDPYELLIPDVIAPFLTSDSDLSFTSRADGLAKKMSHGEFKRQMHKLLKNRRRK